jgi:hypothetical protein
MPVDENGTATVRTLWRMFSHEAVGARASRPTQMIHLRALDALARVAAEMPGEAVEALRTSWRAGLSGGISAR